MNRRMDLLRGMAGLPKYTTAQLVRSEDGHAGVYVSRENYHQGDQIFDLDGNIVSPQFEPQKKQGDGDIVLSDRGGYFLLEIQADGEVTKQRVRRCENGAYVIDPTSWEGENIITGFDGNLALRYNMIPVGNLTRPETEEHERALELFSIYPEGLKTLGKGRFAGKNGLGEQEIDLAGEPRSGYFDWLERGTKWYQGTTGVRLDFVGGRPEHVLNFLEDGEVVERGCIHGWADFEGSSIFNPRVTGKKYELRIAGGIGMSTGDGELDEVFPEGVKRPEDVTQFGDLSVVKLANTGYHIVNLGEGARYGPYTSVERGDELVATVVESEGDPDRYFEGSRPWVEACKHVFG